MADQQTLNASPIQACRSSEVSATAAEHQKALIKAAVTGTTAFSNLKVFKTKPPDKLRKGAHRYGQEGKRPQSSRLWLFRPTGDRFKQSARSPA
jgi:hypothetical protein